MTKPELEKISDSLKKSPLFNLSLASKELFHSNFLAWLIENNSDTFLTEFPFYLRNQLGFDGFDCTENYSFKRLGVDRERLNFDLSFYLTSSESKCESFVIIENKLKSLPRKEQLDDYSKKVTRKGNKNFVGILLSLIEPKFQLPENWKWWSYENYLNFLKRFASPSSESYKAQLINDYISFTGNLKSLIPSSLESHKFNFHSDNRLPTLRKLRIYDIFLKSQYYLLGEKIFQSLQAEFENLVNVTYGTPIKIEDFNNFIAPQIFVNSGFSRSQGQLDIKFLIKKGLALTVQIQGERYYKMIQDSVNQDSDFTKKKRAFKAKDDAEFWFQFEHIDPEPLIYPKYPNKKDKKYNQYLNYCFHKSIKLGNELPLEKLIAYIQQDMRTIYEHKDSFLTSHTHDR